MDMYGIKTAVITKLIIQKTGVYQQQYRRPYSTQIGSEKAMDDIVNAVGNSRVITPATIATATSDFILPSAQPEAMVNIPNGWQNERLRYFLEITITDQINMVKKQYITGCTEYSDLSYNGKIDPNMRFFINNSILARTQNVLTNIGKRPLSQIYEVSHILVNNDFSHIQQSDQLYTMKPDAIVSNMSNASFLNTEGYDTNSFIDTSTLLTRNVIAKSNRVNNIASNYVSSLLDGYLQIQKTDNESHFHTLETLKRKLGTNPIETDCFLGWLKTLNTNRGFGLTSADSFSYNDLMIFDPNVVNVTILANTTQNQGATMMASAHWGGSDINTQTAAIISQTLPAFMTSYGYCKVHLISTNYTSDGLSGTSLVSIPKTMNVGIDENSLIASFIEKLDRELFTLISHNNQIYYKVEINCDMFGETWITMQLGNEPTITYVAPSFADSFTTPIVTNNQANLNNISSDLHQLMFTVNENESNKHLHRASNGVII